MLGVIAVVILFIGVLLVLPRLRNRPAVSSIAAVSITPATITAIPARTPTVPPTPPPAPPQSTPVASINSPTATRVAFPSTPRLTARATGTPTGSRGGRDAQLGQTSRLPPVATTPAASAAAPTETEVVTTTAGRVAALATQIAASATPSATPLPQPIELRGRGDTTVDIDKWEGPALILSAHYGDGDFVVETYDAERIYVDTPVETTETYLGVVPIDFFTDEHAAQLRIRADGRWRLVVYPLFYVTRITVPGTFSDDTDNVILLQDGTGDLQLAVDVTDGEFRLWSYGNETRSLLLDDTAPIQTTVTVPADELLLVIEAEDSYRLEASSE